MQPITHARGILPLMSVCQEVYGANGLMAAGTVPSQDQNPKHENVVVLPGGPTVPYDVCARWILRAREWTIKGHASFYAENTYVDPATNVQYFTTGTVDEDFEINLILPEYIQKETDTIFYPVVFRDGGPNTFPTFTVAVTGAEDLPPGKQIEWRSRAGLSISSLFAAVTNGTLHFYLDEEAKNIATSVEIELAGGISVGASGLVPGPGGQSFLQYTYTVDFGRHEDLYDQIHDPDVQLQDGENTERAGEVDLQIDEEYTMAGTAARGTLGGSGAITDLQLVPTEFWTYGGRYDAATGLEV